MKASRRKFISVSIKGAALFGFAGLVARLALKDDFVAECVRKKLPYLKVGSNELARFAADYRHYAAQGQKKVLAFCAVLAPLYRWQEGRGRSTALGELEDKIAGSFLMSCDLFSQGADISKEIHYVNLYRPYDQPCGY